MSIQLLGDIHQVQERTLNAHELILFEREHEFNNEYNDNYGGQIDYNEDEGDEENCDENEFIPKYLNDGRLIGIEQQIEFLKIQEDAFGAALHANNPCNNQVEQERQYESSDEESEEVQESGLEQYRSLQKIGEGTYGVVYKAYDIKNQQTVAIKKVKLDQDCNEGVPQTTLREISILKALEEHPNIVGLKDVIFKFNKNQLFLVFEFIDHDLGWYLKNTKEITPHQVKLIMYQILNGLNFCHSRRIIHRDLKPANILIDNQGNIKIADFGLSKTFSVPVKTLTYEVETLFYRAPEILLGMQKYSLGIDMWALGCIFFELLERRILFMCDSEIDAIFKIFQLHGTPSAESFHGIKEFIHFKATFPRFKAQDPTQVFQYVRGEALDLLMQMIALNPKDRITVKEALQHPYFDSLSSVEKNKYQNDNNPNELDLNYFSYC